MKIVSEEAVIERWGTQEEYYKELERFHQQHKGKDIVITYHSELNAPVSATYYFRPVQVWAEHHQLLQALRDQAPLVSSDEEQEPVGKE